WTLRDVLGVAGSEHAWGLHHAAELRGRDLVLVDAAVGEAAEAAVGIEEDLLGSEVAECFLDAAHDLFHRLDLVGSRVDHAQADLAPGERASHDRDLPGARS